jgi:hypothetical protein
MRGGIRVERFSWEKVLEGRLESCGLIVDWTGLRCCAFIAN